MSNIRQTIKKVNIPTTGTVRVADAPSIEPFTGMYINVSSKGVMYGAGDVDWEVIYGGRWKGKPYESEHVDGLVKGSGTITDSEIAHLIHADLSMFPSNDPVVPQVDTLRNIDHPGFPIVLKIVNGKSKAIDLYVSFLSSIYYRY